MRRTCLVGLVTALAGAVSATAAEPWGGDAIAPIVAPFPMPQLQRPVFGPATVDIRDSGARAEAGFANTTAIAQAIARCAEAGGGRVVVPAGRWETGPIHLRSGIELHLSEGAVLVFSDRPEDYLPVVPVRVGGVELYNYSPLIYARQAERVGITGPGRLDGNAAAWWPWKTQETRAFFAQARAGVPPAERRYGTREAAIRPSFVVFYECRDVLLEGFTIGSGPNWTIHPIYSENIIIRRVNVLTDGPNNDGIDPDSCRNVLIEHCVFDTGDDCVVLKSGYDEDCWRVARPTENVVMRWCVAKRGHGGLVIGSEMSGDVRRVYVHDCQFDGTDRAVRLKSRRGRGGVVEDIWAENLQVNRMQREAVILNFDYASDPNAVVSDRLPVFRRIHLRHLHGNGAPVAIRITGRPESPIADVTLEDIHLTTERGMLVQHARGLVLRRVQIHPQTGAALVWQNVTGAVVEDFATTAPVWLQMVGEGQTEPQWLGPPPPATALQHLPDWPATP